MNDTILEFRKQVETVLKSWGNAGDPGRSAYETAISDLAAYRKQHNDVCLWQNPPLMLSATLDDAFGHGITIIDGFAEAVGIRVVKLGLCVPAKDIVDACMEHQPDLLGMTVLQFDSEDDLFFISKNKPEKTVMIAGGPIFKADEKIALRTGVRPIANASRFLEFVLSL